MKAFYPDAAEDVVIVRLEDGETREFSIDDFVACYGEDALPEREETPVEEYDEIELYSKDYWNAALSLINIWADYQAKKKLYINASHPETYFKVKNVLEKSFGGNFGKLKNRRNQLSKLVDEEIESFENICSGYGVEPVNRDWLYHKLECAKDYASLRKKCKSRMNKPAESLKNLY